MKTNKLQVILTTVAIGTIAMIATTKIAASYFSAMAVTVSCIAVAILVALAVLDYRVGSKNYPAR